MPNTFFRNAINDYIVALKRLIVVSSPRHRSRPLTYHSLASPSSKSAMERPLTPVPVPTLKDSTDIHVYVEVDSESAPLLAACVFCFLTALTFTNICADCTSLHGTRSAEDFIALLKQVIIPHDFHLETLEDRKVVNTDCAIGPGEYIVGAFISAYLHCIL